MLLRSCTYRQVFRKRSAFYILYLHNNITILLILKVQNKASYFINFLKKIYFFIAFFTLSVRECFTIFFINGIYKTLMAQKLPRSTFFIKNFLQICFCSNIYNAISLFLKISKNKKHIVPDTYYINNDCANVIKFIKVTSNRHNSKSAKNNPNPKRISRK